MKHLSRIGFTLLLLLSSAVGQAQSLKAYVITFSYQNAFNRPNKSHTAATFFLVEADRVVDQVDISWLPQSNYFVGRSGAEVPTLRQVPGANYALAQSFDFAERLGEALLRFGPYETTLSLFDRAKAQRRRLNSGAIDYKMLDRGSRPQGLNCIHAVTDVAGFTSTGVLRGADASAFVIDHFARAGYLRSWQVDNRLYEAVKPTLLLNRNED